MDDPGRDPDLTSVVQRPSKATPDHSKPILILVCLQGMHIQVRFQRLLARLERDADLHYAHDVSSVDKIIRGNRGSVAGILITDARIMDPKNEILSHCLASLPRCPARLSDSPSATSAPIPIPNTTNNNQMNPTHHPQPVSGVPGHRPRHQSPPSEKYETIPLIFAFDFPAQAARHPLNFTRYMRDAFGLSWRITGKTLNKIKLGLRQSTLRKMDCVRRYRTQFEMQAVFLRGVKMADKVLIATGEFAPGGQPDCEGVCGEGEIGGWGGVETESSDCLSSEGGEGGGEDEEKEKWQQQQEAEEELDEEGYDEEQARKVRLRRGHLRALEWLRRQSAQAFSPPSPPRSLPPPADEIPVNEPSGEHPSEKATDNDDDEINWADDELDLTLEPLQLVPPNQSIYSRRLFDELGIPNPRKANWVPSDDEGTIADLQIADSPVVIHEIKTVVTLDRSEGPVLLRGYVGFVGHVTDSRSLGSLILGMCAVSPFVEGA